MGLMLESRSKQVVPASTCTNPRVIYVSQTCGIPYTNRFTQYGRLGTKKEAVSFKQALNFFMGMWGLCIIYNITLYYTILYGAANGLGRLTWRVLNSPTTQPIYIFRLKKLMITITFYYDPKVGEGVG